MTRLIPGFAVMALLSLSHPASAALEMWVVENQSDQVFRVNLQTLSATLVGSANVDVRYGGLGFARDGTLYCYGTQDPIDFGYLYTVDQVTGNYSLIGGGDVWGTDTFDIHPLTDEAVAWSVGGSLHNVDLATGGTSFRAELSPHSNGTASAFGADGTYYQLSHLDDVLNTVDLDTGAVTEIGLLGVDLHATSLGYNPDDGLLYTIQIGDANYPLYQIDPSTGSATFVGNVCGLPDNSSQQITMATFNVAGNQVPEPGTLAIWSLLGGLGLAAGYRRRRAV